MTNFALIDNFILDFINSYSIKNDSEIILLPESLEIYLIKFHLELKEC